MYLEDEWGKMIDIVGQINSASPYTLADTEPWVAGIAYQLLVEWW